MPDALDQVLRLVAEGRLTAAEAEPILDALGADALGDDGHDPNDEPDPESTIEDDGRRGQAGGASSLRIEVSENGRKVVNLRIPVALGRMALDRIPGLSDSSADLVRRALADRRTGTLLVVDDEDGDGVRIALE
jgi:hypothetical protein